MDEHTGERGEQGSSEDDSLAKNVYAGDFLHGKFHGVGQYVNRLLGTSYTGHWQNDAMEGVGLFEWPDRRHAGNYADSTFEGPGIYDYYESGDSYRGEFRDGLKKGKGVYFWSYGNVYSGEFSDNVKQGLGVWSARDGRSYAGEIHDDEFHGIGVYAFADSTRTFAGQYTHNERNGLGCFNYSTATRFCGQWKAGVEDGYGIMYNNSLELDSALEEREHVQNDRRGQRSRS